MDEIADNYDPDANVHDDLCEYWGCLDETASNFDEEANVDDGSCLYPGCTDNFAENFDETSNIGDGSCRFTDVHVAGLNNDILTCENEKATVKEK
eukprot:UN33955